MMILGFPIFLAMFGNNWRYIHYGDYTMVEKTRNGKVTGHSLLAQDKWVASVKYKKTDQKTLVDPNKAFKVLLEQAKQSGKVVL
jgi:hypothetical protein